MIGKARKDVAKFGSIRQSGQVDFAGVGGLDAAIVG
jgi:hypothetical protein